MTYWFKRHFGIDWDTMKRHLKLIASFVVAGLVFMFLGCKLGSSSIWGTFFISLGAVMLTIGLVSITAEIIALVNVIKIIRLYGDHVAHGIVRVFPSCEDPEYLHLRSDSRKCARRVGLLTLVGREFIQDQKAFDNTLALMKKKEEFRLQVLDPTCKHWKIQYEDFEPVEDIDVIGCTQPVKIKERYDLLKDKVKLLKKPGVEVRYYDRKPVFRIEYYDELIFVSFYGLRSRAKCSPIIAFQAREKSPVTRYFMSQFDCYWGRKFCNDAST